MVKTVDLRRSSPSDGFNGGSDRFGEKFLQPIFFIASESNFVQRFPVTFA
jgi:hypothetical protein